MQDSLIWSQFGPYNTYIDSELSLYRAVQGGLTYENVFFCREFSAYTEPMYALSKFH